MAQSISDSQAKKDQLNQVLELIRQRLKKLQDEIQTFNGYEKLESEKKALEKCLYLLKLKKVEADVEKLAS